ncbi:planctomycete cytochrome c [Haloferula helveola]|uniref:Planctomycete cytochrome c n=1 Tax=Haloferula helveola TaxID=490095 RepID=A0ABN6H599_9BACT|nr:planctomycete cytochrome c [Haloferula helveola]
MRVLISALYAASALHLAAEEAHWAYEPPAAAEVSDGHPVDVLLAKKRAEAGVERAGLADPGRWVERAAFTLTGLPPSDAQKARIAADPSSYEAILDELMASPAYGEHWARHWMDVARYADTFGYNFQKDNRLPYSWTYRDWLIGAFNRDLAWSEFVKLQVAADLLVDRPDHPDLAALGFLTIGPRGRHEEVVDDRVDVVTRGFMGTTVSCARCHDHKTDPISMTDYYSFFSILENLEPDTSGPVIGKVDDPKAAADYEKKRAVIEAENLKARNELLADFRNPEKLGVYLELAWLAKQENWKLGKADSMGFKQGRYRGKAILRWRDFLKRVTEGKGAVPRLVAWNEAMAKQEADRKQLCRGLAGEWLNAPAESPLGRARERGDCLISLPTGRAHELFDTQDSQGQRDRDSRLAKLAGDHPGAPPRAMVVRDRANWAPARVYNRGNPADRGEPFDRHWLTPIGGGNYPEGRNARLVMAEKLVSPDNPLTDRVIVNRAWAWHFGEPLADLDDFGPQQGEPLQLELLDWLAVWFRENGGSLKKLHRLLLTSEAFRLKADGPASNREIDEANRTFWKWKLRRLDFEPMRDRILLSSGSLKTDRIGGRPVELDKPAARERRSVYGFIDRFELPGLLVNFDLPHPDHHAPRRVPTTVPQQALFFLNGRLPVTEARRLANDAEFRAINDPQERTRWLYRRVLGRDAAPEEVSMVTDWVSSAESGDYEPKLGGAWEVGHVPVDGNPSGSLKPFPLFGDGVWKTGHELDKAPIRYLHAGPDRGHPAFGHLLVLRWRSSGSGEIRIIGNIKRHVEGGADLRWDICGPSGSVLASQPVPVGGASRVKGPWVEVAEGDTVNLVIAAPETDAFGSLGWNFRVEGRDASGVTELSGFGRDFPRPGRKLPAPVRTGDPWCDVIQVLWASNEFNHLD